MSQPVVTVLMSVYNGQDYLAEAIDSILAQTFKDFEFLIIDDGSSDKSPAILKKYATRDKRIELLAQKNQGLVPSLNRGIKEASGKYIARQDADDQSAPNRLAKQVKFLESNPNTVIVGSSIEVMDEASNILHRHAILLDDPELRQELLLRSPFAHGSVTFNRQSAIEAGLYDPASWPAEDYDLWLRLSKYGKLANLDEYLYIYREHGSGISVKNLELQQKKLKEVQDKAWKERSRLLPKKKIDLAAYKNLDMGELRIGRIIDNNVFISKSAWRCNQKTLALKNMSILAGDRVTYRKAAGKLKRKLNK